MKPQETSREELKRELQELRQKYNTLKASYEKDITDRRIIEDTFFFISELKSAHLGSDFFTTLARYLGDALSVDYVLVDRVKNGKNAKTIANYQFGDICPNMEYSLTGTPSESIYGNKLCSYPRNVQTEFPEDNMLVKMNAESYSGVPLWDSDRNPLGLIALIHTKPLHNIKRIESVLKLVSGSTGREIERLEAERKLRESEEKYRNIFENVDDVFYQTDMDGIALEISPSVKILSGFTRDELLGKPVHHLYYDPGDREILLDTIKKDGELKDYQLRLKTKSGKIKYVSVNARLMKNTYNSTEFINGAIRDITERKLEQEALKESEYFFKESQKAAFIGSYKADFISGKWESSEVMDQIFGIDKKYYRSVEGWINIVHPDDREMMERYLNEEVLGKHNAFNKEYRIIRKNDGQVRWVFGLGKVNLDGQGKVISLIGTIQDITERRLDEYKIRQLSYAVDATSEVVFMTNKDGIFTFVNPAFTAVYGYHANEVIGKTTPRILKSGRMDDSHYKHFWNELLNNRVVQGEFINKTVDGKEIYIEAAANAVIGEEGNVIGFIAIQKDITQRKQIEHELLSAKENAEISDRLKSAFLSNMSHEIRTPMNGILGFAELLQDTTLSSDEMHEYVHAIQVSGERMLSTINSIIDISKIESGMTKVDITEENINEAMELIYKFFKPECESKNLNFSYTTDLPSGEALIKTDYEKVYGVLTNLVKNAIKFTDAGTIKFGYEKKGKYLEFFVEDTGKGLAKSQHEIIFERFRQGSESYNRGYEGSGLGLSICKSYVEMLGGKVWLESEEGLGSKFYFTIPYNRVLNARVELASSTYDEPEDVQIKNLKILVAEDDELSYTFLSRCLQKFKKEILHAVTGIEAVDECKNNPDIDLVLMDIHMPYMNGYEATRRIRQFNKNVVIIAQTAYGLSGDREKSITSGCNDYISKPINKDNLLTIIQRYFDPEFN